MTIHSTFHTPSPAETLIEEARAARLEQQAMQIATHIRSVLSRLKSRPKPSSDGA
jgi:hypothetical protein